MAYSSHISWQNATSPVPMEVYPSLAFDSLFDNRGSRRNQSVLDRVQENAISLKRQISADDQAKLDEYLTSVREVEKKIERMRDDTGKAVDRAQQRGTHLATMQRPDNGLPEDIREHMRLMCDIVALAFQNRQDTFCHAPALSRHLRSVLPVPRCAQRASLGFPRRWLAEFERISRYYCSQLAYLAKRLDEMPEGEGTVLDNSCIMFVNNMWSGSKHDSTKVPLLTAGGLGEAGDRPRARLQPARRRESQAVQFLSLAHESHGPACPIVW